MLGEVVSVIGKTRGPLDFELTLASAVADPPEAHVHGFGAARFDFVIGDTSGCGVVTFDNGSGLGIAKFFESCADAAGGLAVVEKAGCFGFSGRRHDVA